MFAEFQKHAMEFSQMLTQDEPGDEVATDGVDASWGWSLAALTGADNTPTPALTEPPPGAKLEAKLPSQGQPLSQAETPPAHDVLSSSAASDGPKTSGAPHSPEAPQRVRPFLPLPQQPLPGQEGA